MELEATVLAVGIGPERAAVDVAVVLLPEHDRRVVVRAGDVHRIGITRGLEEQFARGIRTDAEALATTGATAAGRGQDRAVDDRAGEVALRRLDGGAVGFDALEVPLRDHIGRSCR